ncbi:MAG: histidine kinase N-terminal 7TM domain-containing protein, partial [Halobacteria archaeon]|nr:histidine kinase N-terminal 7TM domain-containing protein [Halobacteria archaeon]
MEMVAELPIFLGLVSSLSAFVFSFLALWKLDRHGRVYSALMIIVGVWSLLYVLQLASPGIEDKIFWLKSRTVISQIVGFTWLIFALEYTGRDEWLEPQYFGILVLPSILVAMLVSTNYGNLFVTSAYVTQAYFLEVTYGPVFWTGAVYVYLLTGMGFWFLGKMFTESFGVYRKQILSLGVSAVFPVLASILHLSEEFALLPNLNPFPNIEPTPYAFTLSVLVLGIAFFNYRLFDIV